MLCVNPETKIATHMEVDFLVKEFQFKTFIVGIGEQREKPFSKDILESKIDSICPSIVKYSVESSMMEDSHGNFSSLVLAFFSRG